MPVPSIFIVDLFDNIIGKNAGNFIVYNCPLLYLVAVLPQFSIQHHPFLKKIATADKKSHPLLFPFPDFLICYKQ